MNRGQSLRPGYDAVIVGSGPNGLAAANVLVDAGFATLVVEAKERIGGGCRTSPLTLPGFLHDDCAAVHPLGVASPYFRTLQLEQHGLRWIEPPAPLAHLMSDGTAVFLEHSVEKTAARLGRDGAAYERLIGPIAWRFEEIAEAFLGPLRFPKRPLSYARFGMLALSSMQGVARRWFREARAGALLGGIAAHAMVPLSAPASSAFAFVLGGAAHAFGWPVARGGSQAIVDALAERFRTRGGDLLLGWKVTDVGELPPARAYLLDVTPRQVLRMTGDRLPEGYRRRLDRFRYGPGVYKMDWALRAPIPWKEPELARAGTVHLSGDLHEVAADADAVQVGGRRKLPFVLLAQPSRFDDSRAPAGSHTAWAYCHVPHASSVDAAGDIEAHIERYAPGFQDVILARHTRSAPEFERYNPNYVGGDINGGAALLSQLLFRPVVRLDPYRTPNPRIFLCSSSTPPGGGVHGMCGYWAAQSAVRFLREDPRPTG